MQEQIGADVCAGLSGRWHQAGKAGSVLPSGSVIVIQKQTGSDALAGASHSLTSP